MFRAWIAASPPSLISTNANPRLRPVSRSITTWALVTVPCWPNASARSSFVVVNEMLPTYSFIELSSRATGPAYQRPAVALRPPRETGWDVTPNTPRNGGGPLLHTDVTSLGAVSRRGSEQCNQDGSVRESGKAIRLLLIWMGPRL